MKKMVLAKAKFYAKKIYDLEQELNTTKDLEETKEIMSKIQDILDEIHEIYEPTAMYKVDEQVYELDKKNKAKS